MDLASADSRIDLAVASRSRWNPKSMSLDPWYSMPVLDRYLALTV